MLTSVTETTAEMRAGRGSQCKKYGLSGEAHVSEVELIQMRTRWGRVLIASACVYDEGIVRRGLNEQVS